METPSTSFRKKHKEEKKPQKHIKKTHEKIKKIKEREKEKLNKKILQAKASSQRSVKIKENKERKKAELSVRKDLKMRETKKVQRRKDSLAHRRTKAYTEVQRYARLVRCDSEWFLNAVDTWERLHYTKVDWWHVYSKKNYPHIAFDRYENIRPITKATNKFQMDGYGERCRKVLSKKDEERLQKKAESVYDRTKLTKEYYIEQYHKYKKLNKEIEEKMKKYLQ